jgi:hypothetical protein
MKKEFINVTLGTKKIVSSISGANFDGTLDLFRNQGCQMVYFQTKNPNVDTFPRALEWEMLLHFMIIWNILWPFCKFIAVWYGWFVAIWYIFHYFSTFGPRKIWQPC